MSQIIINGQPVYQVDLPEMTLAQWQALPVAERPKEWIRTDADYTDIPAENVSYGSGSVKDALDELSTSKYETISGTTGADGILLTNFTKNDFIIISAISAGSVVVPYINAGNVWRFRVTDGNGNIKANTAITIYAYYIKP